MLITGIERITSGGETLDLYRPHHGLYAQLLYISKYPLSASLNKQV